MDVIAAISTANVLSAIGIVRVSGEGCFAVCDKVFQPAGGGLFSASRPREMTLGRLLDREGQAVDSCLAVRFPGPGSYTGEDCAEFHCHGSPVVLGEALEALFAAGARQAGRGEFTKRAFLNGRMDLTQAEAVIDLIESETAQAARNAVEQLGGALRQRVEPVYSSLLDLTSQFYAVVDYPDEDIEDLRREDMLRTLAEAEETLQALLATFRRGKILRQGVPTAILGRPNAGKSSLLNALLGYDRAIVTSVAGTTRDTVEEKAVVGGVLLRLIDTAGIRDTGDAVERLGVERAQKAAAAAELVLLVLDGSQPLTAEDRAAAEAAQGSPHVIVIRNKCDLPQAVDRVSLEAGFPPALPVSAKEGTGLDNLEAAVAALFPAGEVPPGHVLTNARQAEAVSRAAGALRGAREALEGGLTPDAALTDTERALNALGELTGRTLREDLVSRIFERFCVGK
ncbi:MAG: tRNA uridine-5-carboxymethylaminomethyl(34) synthesis GTPase MnmE [Oscillospiraceae bacterium]|nr:tRNA uridine-5-carboxymethylaminomethyl(34) synthesis GTPase MnmE [Oscillospiraceae bacterium]